MKARIVFISALGLVLSACQHAHTASLDRRSADCAAPAPLQSEPGQRWLADQGWRFRSPAEAEAAYARLLQDASPWPDWYMPQEVTLPAGTRFQMALSGAQLSSQPGRFGTFDHIDDVAEVRNGLAVREEWKPDVAKVVTYEIVRPVKARVGPVGPQIDPGSCRVLWGRLSQLEFLVPREEIMSYLTVIDERPIR